MAQTHSWSKWFLILFSFLVFVNVAHAEPARVLIIRHAEKLDDDNPHLSPRGQQRAQALTQLFTKHPELASNGLPVAIFAAAPKHAGSSLRPIETVTPLAQSLHLTINTEFTKSEVAAIVEEISRNPAYDGKTVLICWEHDSIADLPPAFGADAAPETWPSGSFDRVWELDFAGDRRVNFRDLGQDLLPGDSK